MLSRRAFVGKLAAGAAVAGAVTTMGSRAEARGTTTTTEPTAGTAGAASAGPASVSTAASAPPPWELLAPLQAGAALGGGWQVAELAPVHAGSSVLTVAHASVRTHRIHLCRNAGAPSGLVHTAEVDLLVMNGGAGELPTDEG